MIPPEEKQVVVAPTPAPPGEPNPPLNKPIIRETKVSFCEEEKEEVFNDAEALGVAKGHLGPQFFAAMAAHMGSITLGTIAGWIAISIPQIRADPDFADMTEDDISWIVSIQCVGVIVGSMLGGLAVDALGSRKTMLLSILPVVATWLVMYFATTFGMLVAGRIVGGFCYGVFMLGAPIYIAETSEPRIRGMLVTATDLMACVGLLITFSLAIFLDWKTICLCCIGVPALYFALLLCVPESPRYLVCKGRHEEALKSLAWLRGLPAQQVKPELQLIIDGSQKRQANASSNACCEFIKWDNFKAFLICIGFSVFHISTGIFTIANYTVDIFETAGVGFDKYVSTTLTGIFAVIGCCIASLLVDRLGRKCMLMMSTLGSTCALGALGYFFYAKQLNPNVGDSGIMKWLPLLGLVGFWFTDAAGMNPIGYSVIAEVLPGRIKGFATGWLRIIGALSVFSLTRFFKTITATIGEAYTFWAFAASCFLCTFYIWFVIPETTGKTLEEIQNDLANHQDLRSKDNKNEKTDHGFN